MHEKTCLIPILMAISCSLIRVFYVLRYDTSTAFAAIIRTKFMFFFIKGTIGN